MPEKGSPKKIARQDSEKGITRTDSPKKDPQKRSSERITRKDSQKVKPERVARKDSQNEPPERKAIQENHKRIARKGSPERIA